jgi:hypothetical protein
VSCVVFGSAAYLEQGSQINVAHVQGTVPLPRPRPKLEVRLPEPEIVSEPKLKTPAPAKARPRAARPTW